LGIADWADLGGSHYRLFRDGELARPRCSADSDLAL